MVQSVSQRTDSYVQFVTVFVIFLFVLFITWFVTRWIAGYQSGSLKNKNFELIDTFRLSNSKLLQIVRVGKKYLVVAVCKDTVTMLSELSEEDIVMSDGNDAQISGFKDIFEKMKQNKILEKEDGRDE